MIKRIGKIDMIWKKNKQKYTFTVTSKQDINDIVEFFNIVLENQPSFNLIINLED